MAISSLIHALYDMYEQTCSLNRIIFFNKSEGKLGYKAVVMNNKSSVVSGLMKTCHSKQKCEYVDIPDLATQVVSM